MAINNCKPSSEEEKVLLAASCFMYPILKMQGKQNEIEEYFKEANCLCEMEEEVREFQGVDSQFLDVFYTWQEKKHFRDVYKLPFIDDDVMENKDKIICYDEKYIFLSDQLFKEIVTPILYNVPISRLKQSLREEGILTTHKNTGTFTVKMSYIDDGGNPKRTTMLRFSQQKLKKAGELDIITICKLGKKEAV